MNYVKCYADNSLPGRSCMQTGAPLKKKKKPAVEVEVLEEERYEVKLCIRKSLHTPHTYTHAHSSFPSALIYVGLHWGA